MSSPTHPQPRSLSTDTPLSAPLFGTIRGLARGPKRRLGPGVAFAVAGHLWLLVAAVSLSSGDPARPEKKELPDVVFVAPPPPPPPPAGAAHAETPRAAETRPRVDPSTYRTPKDTPPDEQPEVKDEKPANEPPAAEAAREEEGQDGGEEGGEKGGVVGGTKGGLVNGELGGVLCTLPATTGITAPPMPSPAAVSAVIHIGEGTDQTAPVWLTSPAPPYPPEALAAKQSGLVLARCNALPDGALAGCRIVKGNPFFDAAVLAHLSSARVKPFTSGGRPVNGIVALNIPVRFTLP